jgi:hypothetical protein
MIVKHKKPSLLSLLLWVYIKIGFDFFDTFVVISPDCWTEGEWA